MVRKITLDEFLAELKLQGVGTKGMDYVFKCPICGTIQSARSLMQAGVNKEDLEKYIGFSCIGRFTGVGSYKKGTPPGKGCDWTLGGLFHFHKLEIVDREETVHMRFEPATPEEAQQLKSELEELSTCTDKDGR